MEIDPWRNEEIRFPLGGCHVSPCHHSTASLWTATLEFMTKPHPNPPQGPTKWAMHALNQLAFPGHVPRASSWNFWAGARPSRWVPTNGCPFFGLKMRDYVVHQVGVPRRVPKWDMFIFIFNEYIIKRRRREEHIILYNLSSVDWGRGRCKDVSDHLSPVYIQS